MSIYDDAFNKSVANNGKISPCPEGCLDCEEWKKGSVDGYIQREIPKAPIKLLHDLVHN